MKQAMGALYKFLPARQKEDLTHLKIVSDFDKLVSEPVGFKFLGRVWKIKPVTNEIFMQVTLQYGKLVGFLQGEGELQGDALFEEYLKFIHPVCPEFKLEDLKKMNMPQLNALIGLIMKHLTGNVYSEANASTEENEKKKTS